MVTITSPVYVSYVGDDFTFAFTLNEAPQAGTVTLIINVNGDLIASVRLPETLSQSYTVSATTLLTAIFGGPLVAQGSAEYFYAQEGAYVTFQVAYRTASQGILVSSNRSFYYTGSSESVAWDKTNHTLDSKDFTLAGSLVYPLDASTHSMTLVVTNDETAQSHNITINAPDGFERGLFEQEVRLDFLELGGSYTAVLRHQAPAAGGAVILTSAPVTIDYLPYGAFQAPEPNAVYKSHVPYQFILGPSATDVDRVRLVFTKDGQDDIVVVLDATADTSGNFPWRDVHAGDHVIDPQSAATIPPGLYTVATQFMQTDGTILPANDRENSVRMVLSEMPVELTIEKARLTNASINLAYRLNMPADMVDHVDVEVTSRGNAMAAFTLPVASQWVGRLELAQDATQPDGVARTHTKTVPDHARVTVTVRVTTRAASGITVSSSLERDLFREGIVAVTSPVEGLEYDVRVPISFDKFDSDEPVYIQTGGMSERMEVKDGEAVPVEALRVEGGVGLADLDIYLGEELAATVHNLRLREVTTPAKRERISDKNLKILVGTLGFCALALLLWLVVAAIAWARKRNLYHRAILYFRRKQRADYTRVGATAELAQ